MDEGIQEEYDAESDVSNREYVMDSMRIYQKEKEMANKYIYEESAYHDQSVDVIIYKKDSKDDLKLLSPVKNSSLKNNDGFVRNNS